MTAGRPTQETQSPRPNRAADLPVSHLPNRRRVGVVGTKLFVSLFSFLFCLFRKTGICSTHSAAVGTPLHALSVLLQALPSRLCTRVRFLARTPLKVARRKRTVPLSPRSTSRGVQFGNGACVVTNNRKGKEKKKDADGVRCCEVLPPVVFIVLPPVFFPLSLRFVPLPPITSPLLLTRRLT